jgi:hypothetical protein
VFVLKIDTVKMNNHGITTYPVKTGYSANPEKSWKKGRGIVL